jgi:hypothetical protein
MVEVALQFMWADAYAEQVNPADKSNALEQLVLDYEKETSNTVQGSWDAAVSNGMVVQAKDLLFKEFLLLNSAFI